ncbi:hypothetical protein BDK51DRAFT_52284 [Blyttiomyces helicus]|uniref:Uncharacterized protein n=1 Tax=Blyttiomyces helicus TaxID=388810 RepID=A0A4P9WEB8_9FUNG|nr:hypothetical protein BDK51DRAFT_52284 [Blyttiomyces helicus]|eukprot:RKO90934.1 hypothetical protein BDK51DRAFT_52284 [Blyttiomyces helicus]
MRVMRRIPGGREGRERLKRLAAPGAGRETHVDTQAAATPRLPTPPRPKAQGLKHEQVASSSCLRSDFIEQRLKKYKKYDRINKHEETRTRVSRSKKRRALWGELPEGHDVERWPTTDFQDSSFGRPFAIACTSPFGEEFERSRSSKTRPLRHLTQPFSRRPDFPGLSDAGDPSIPFFAKRLLTTRAQRAGRTDIFESNTKAS